MKHLTLLTLLLVISYFGKSQNYISFPDSATIWINESLTVNPNPVPHCEHLSYAKYCVNGEDTIINSTFYTKVKICQSSSYEGGIRDDNGKVYYVPVDDTSEVLLYDFTLDSGDTVYQGTWNIPWDIEVQYVDSIEIQGTYRKRLYLGDVQWVEGVGNISTGLFGENVSNISGYCFDLACMSINDSTLFPNENNQPCALDLSFDESEFENKISVYPNPTKDGTISIQHQEENLNYTIINSRGQEIKRGQLLEDQLGIADIPGIYFVFLYNDQGQVVRKIVVE